MFIKPSVENQVVVMSRELRHSPWIFNFLWMWCSTGSPEESSNLCHSSKHVPFCFTMKEYSGHKWLLLPWDLLSKGLWAVLLLHFLLLAQFGGSSLWGSRSSLCSPACTAESSGIPYLVAVLEKAVFASQFLFQVLNEGLFCPSNFLVWCLLHRVDAGLFVIHGLWVTTYAGRENKVIPIGLLDYLLQLHRMPMKMWACLLKTVVWMNPQSIREVNRPSWVIEYENLKGKKHHGAAKSLSVLPQYSFSIPAVPLTAWPCNPWPPSAPGAGYYIRFWKMPGKVEHPSAWVAKVCWRSQHSVLTGSNLVCDLQWGLLCCACLQKLFLFQILFLLLLGNFYCWLD